MSMRRKILITSCIPSITICMLLFFTTMAFGYSLSITGDLNGSPGDTVTAKVNVGVPNLGEFIAADIYIGFDHSVLNFKAAYAGADTADTADSSEWLVSGVEWLVSGALEPILHVYLSVMGVGFAPREGLSTYEVAAIDFGILPTSITQTQLWFDPNSLIGDNMDGLITPTSMTGATVNVNAKVPEPSTFVLLGAGVAFLLVSRRRKKGIDNK
jgi:hypothetical protein